MAFSATARRIFESWVGLPDVTAARRWGLVAVIDSIGTGMRLPTTVLYFTVVVGLRPEMVGIGLGVAGVLAAVGAPIAGALVDRFGAKRMVIICFCLASVGYLGYLGATTWVVFVLVVTVAQLADYASKPAKWAFVASIVGSEYRVGLMAFNRSIRNVGYGAGGLVTAGLLALGGDSFAYHTVLVIDGLSYLAAAFMVARIPASFEPAAQQEKEKQEDAGGFREVLRDRRFVALAVLDVLVLIHGSAFSVGMPLWVDQHTSSPTAMVGVLFTANTVLIVLLQVRMTKGMSRASQMPSVYLRSFLFFGLGAGLYALGGQLGGLALVIAVLVGAVLAHTISELYASAGEWTVSFDLSPPRLRGRYLSLFALSSSIQHGIGPAIVTILIARVPELAWYLLFAIQAVGCVGTALLVRGVKSRQEPEPASAEEVKA